jgi:hypothetical protein
MNDIINIRRESNKYVYIWSNFDIGASFAEYIKTISNDENRKFELLYATPKRCEVIMFPSLTYDPVEYLENLYIQSNVEEIGT